MSACVHLTFPFPAATSARLNPLSGLPEVFVHGWPCVERAILKVRLLLFFILVFICVGLVAAIEQMDRARFEQTTLLDIETRLKVRTERLDKLLKSMAQLNRSLADTLNTNPDIPEPLLEAKAKAAISIQPRIASVVVSRGLKVAFVYPIKGNEAIIGLDFGLHPEFMDSIKRAVRSQNTVVDVPMSLLQTGRPGVILRTPFFDKSNKAKSTQGHVSMAADLEGVLLEAGFLEPDNNFILAIRSRSSQGVTHTIFGSSGVFQRPHVQTSISLPDSSWELGATPVIGLTYTDTRAWWIRSLGALVTFFLVFAYLRRSGLIDLHPAHGELTALPQPRLKIPLRTFLLIAVLLITPLIVAISGWLSYKASMNVAKQLEQQQIAELANQLRDRVTAFFEVPRRVATFNAEQFQNGMLDLQDRDHLLRNFLLQLRQQPLLTFLSMGTKEGEYFATSRPPIGKDKALRILQATERDHRVMTLFRVDDTGQRSSPTARANNYFDARIRPWFQEAVAADSIRWYPAYRYAIQDAQGIYDALGMGMSAPLYDVKRQFIGVVTADVSLSQVSSFLTTQIASLGGIAFLAEQGGELLASSTDEPIYRLDGDRVMRFKTDESDNPIIRMAGMVIRTSKTHEDNRFVAVNGECYLIHWQTIQLPDGPALTIGFALPESRFADTARQAFGSISFLACTCVALGVLLALMVAQWLARPLLSLSLWAKQLANGNWQAEAPYSSPVLEVSNLTLILHNMATRLQSHAEQLEQQVAERTASLEEANRQLARLSVTDGLTGVANRRHFDEVLAAEWARATRTEQPLALIMLDVDFFKQYNDRYGHPAGDAVLKRIATVMAKNARRISDLAARYGGEEFVLIAANTGRDVALHMAQAIRQGVEELAIPHEGALVGHVTVSLGMVVMEPNRALTTHQLIACADAALYQAKSNGRNQVMEG